MPACEAVHPYVPDPRIDWAEVNPETAELSTNCTGDFADPVINGEMRRFLWRDGVSLIMLFIGLFSVGLASLASMALGLRVASPVTLGVSIFAVLVMAVALPLDAVAFLRMSQTRFRTATIRMVCATMYGVVTAPRMLETASRSILDCGDQDAIHLNITNPNNTATIMAAIEDRQKYCIETIHVQLISMCCALIPIMRIYPQHAVAMIPAACAFLGVGYLFRPSAEEERYEDSAASLGVDMAFQVVCGITSVLLGYRLHATNRGRFIAAAAAERARRLAVRELAEVDALLKRSLPEAVLERVAVGADVTDRSELVSVLLSDLAGFTAWSSSRSAQQVVSMLNILVSAFDDRLAGAPGVEKVKTIGDAYWAVAGLPLPVACHASVLCRFALGMQATAHALAAEHAAAWGGADAVRMRVGVHSGRASGSILGTQRLSYEPFGEACEGAEEAEKNCAAGTVYVTGSTKTQLTAEARAYGGDCDNDSLFATAQDAEALLEHVTDVNVKRPSLSGMLLLYLLPTHVDRALQGGDSMSPPVEGNPLQAYTLMGASRRSRASAATVELSVARTMSVSSATVDTSRGSVAAWAATRIHRQRKELEQRMQFVLERAKKAEALARDREREMEFGAKTVPGRRQRHHHTYSHAADGDAAVAIDAPSINHQHLDAGTTGRLAELEDEDSGPFAPASRVPLLYTFASESEEEGYISSTRLGTREMRRDVRIGTAALFLVTCVSHAATGESPAGTAMLGIAFVVALVNAALLVAGAPNADQADTVLAYVSFLFELVGCYLADGNVVGNDPYWIFPVQTTFVDLTAHTLSPLTRTILNTGINFASIAKLVVLGKGDVARNFSIFAASLFILPWVKAIIERFSRRAYVERRLAEALASQELTAKHVQVAMLENVVPSHAVQPLRKWLAFGFAKEHAVAEFFPYAVVARIDFVSFAACAGQQHGAAAPSCSWMLAAHRTLDALVDRCVFATKVKTNGSGVLLGGPFRQDAFDPAPFFATAIAEHAGVAATIAEVIFVVKALVELGAVVRGAVAVGPITGAVLGTERLSYDVIGGAADAVHDVVGALAASPPPPTPASPPRDAAFELSTQPGTGLALTKAALMLLKTATSIDDSDDGDDDAERCPEALIVPLLHLSPHPGASVSDTRTVHVVEAASDAALAPARQAAPEAVAAVTGTSAAPSRHFDLDHFVTLRIQNHAAGFFVVDGTAPVPRATAERIVQHRIDQLLDGPSDSGS